MTSRSFFIEYQAGGYYIPVTFPVSITSIDRSSKTITYHEPQGLRTEGFSEHAELSDFAQWLIEKSPSRVEA